MKIRPKEIPIFQNGGVPQWYLDRYGNRTSLINWNRQLDYSHSNQNLNNNGHRNAGTLQTAYDKNMSYIGTPSAVASDIQSFYNSDGKDMSAKDFETFYNNQADIIRSHWTQDRTYGESTAGDHNRLYRRMFQSRSNQTLNPSLNEIYNIGYQDDQEDIEGSSTWLRRMDQYENENESDTNRIHEITLKDGSKAKYYKTSNGNIKLLSTDSQNGAPSQVNTIGATPPNPTRSLEELQSAKPQLRQQDGSVNVNQFNEPESKWKIFGDRLKNAAPDIIEALRLAGNLHNNNRVYDAVLKGIRPNLQQTYNTYRQVVGDEATKQAYYRRGIAGQTKAGQAFTSDADRQMAYQMEAKRAADELKAQGDLADNAEIRRTSDESNQHQWANIQRATEVANRNLIEMNNANAAKWNLRAQKYSADWTNWDNYLMGIQNRMTQKKQEQEAFNRQLAQLDIQDDYINDDWLQSLELQRQNLYTQYQSITGTDEESKTKKESLQNQILQKNKEINSRKLQLQKDSLKKMYPEYAKSGTKIEYKATDKYLYKTSKDLVEHFRKMSKMADDSRLKSRTKPIKLSSHPKGNTRKYQQGGVAPFTVFRPLGIGGESVIGSQTTSSGSSKSSSSSSSGKDDAAKNKLDLVKELFKSLKGLPVDVNMAYKDIYSLFEKSKLFGEELSTDDIAGIYLNSMRAVSQLQYGQEVYEKAKNLATSNEALNEYAVTSDGSYVVSDKDGNLSYKKNLKEIEESGLVPITNQQLINMRAYSPNMVGQRGDTIIENIIGNGMGINKIGAQIKDLAGNIGATEGKLEGISQVESGKVKAGLQILAGTAGTPDGHYSVTTYTKDQQSQIQAALRYINNMLSPAQKATLEAHGGVEQNIMLFLGSQQDYIKEQAISPLTGKAAKDSNGNSKEDSEGLKLDAASAFITGKGYNTNIELNTGSNYAVNVKARYSEFQKHSGENMGAGITMQEASTSTLKGVLDWNKATLGGSTLNPSAYNHIILNNGEVAGVDLPTKPGDKNTPDFEMLKKLEQLDEQLMIKGIEDVPENYQRINELCNKLGLPPKYDNSGKLNKQSWNRFAAFQVTTTEKALNNKNVILDMLGIADDQTREFYEEIIQDKTKNNKYSLDNGWPIFGGKEELYQGTVFVPVKNSLVAGAISSGQKISMTDAVDLELKQRGYDKQKISTYKKNELVL